MDKGFNEDREKLEERYVPSPELTNCRTEKRGREGKS